MKLNRLEDAIINSLGKTVQTTDEDKSPFTVRKALQAAVLEDVEDKPGQKGNSSSKLQRYDLYKKLKKGQVQFTVEEINLLKESALLGYATLFAGQIVDAIEGN